MNPRPTVCQTVALPAELHPRIGHDALFPPFPSLPAVIVDGCSSGRVDSNLPSPGGTGLSQLSYDRYRCPPPAEAGRVPARGRARGLVGDRKRSALDARATIWCSC